MKKIIYLLSILFVVSCGTNQPPSEQTVVTEVAEEPKTEIEEEPQVEQTAGGGYCGSRRSEVYHYKSCSSVPTIKESNYVEYSSPEDAWAHGKRPCKRCNPP